MRHIRNHRHSRQFVPDGSKAFTYCERWVDPALTVLEDETGKATDICTKCAERVDCGACRVRRAGGMEPSHDGSGNCRSGSIASGGSRAHCTCDTCF